MKKITILFSSILFLMLSFTSCNDDNDPPPPIPIPQPDNDTIAEVFELNDVKFEASKNYENLLPIDPEIGNGDNIIAYRYTGRRAGTSIWEPLPKIILLKDTPTAGNTGELTYNFDFTKRDIKLIVTANYDLTTGSSTPDYLNNQTFRVVIIPGSIVSNSTNNKNSIDYNDYNAVIKHYNIDESKIKVLK